MPSHGPGLGWSASMLSLALSVAGPGQSTQATAAAAQACSQRCLQSQLDGYLQRLLKHDPSGLALTPLAETRENTQRVPLGRSDSWMRISAIRARQYFYDLDSQNVVVRAAVEMTDGKIGSLSVRLALSGRKIAEVDTSFNQGTGPFDADNLVAPDILWEAVVPPERRSSRADMIKIVNLYFDGISKHDASLPPFAKRCDRYESGKKMTNDFTNRSNESGAVTCGDSLLHLTGQEVVQRRAPLIDERLGVVLAYGFILHDERNPPQATGLAEMFKIVDGRIREIENVETIVSSPPDGGFVHEVLQR